MPSLYELTKYPRLYKNTYWGSFGSDSYDVGPEIISNRNKFAEKYNLKRLTNRMYKSVAKEFDGSNGNTCSFDHVEVYVDFNGNYVIVSSPYCNDDFKYLRLGWSCYDQLYSGQASTYIKVVLSDKNKNKNNKKRKISKAK